MQLPVLFVGILAGATLLDAASVPGGSGEDRIRWMLRDTAETTTVDTSTNNDADVGDGSEFQYDATTTSDSDDDNAGEVRMLTLDYNPAELYAYIDQVLISPCYTHSQAPLNILLNLYTCLDRVTGFNKKIDLFQATPDNVSFANLPLVRRLDVSQTSSGLQVLLRQFKDNAPQICMNPEPVMQCLDAYLQACFPPPAASNDTSSDDAWMRDVAAFVDMFNTNRSDTDASTAEPATSEATTLEPATTEATTEEASSTHEPGTMEPTTTAESEDSTNNDSLPVLVVAEVDVTITRLDDGPASGFFGVPF
ncbi:uncharacterized protein LOC129598395 [Paramacrobiotus metropolitanus]|uniref:uncharacterized protein LOC129598395 n=1 Tax=Paramacrobiotus metropolitanus TaxID=2943436 RepID=UPI002445799E|nr:uncharacterized protein LOC129598395 [Paramacrobiotus metropolitanus]